MKQNIEDIKEKVDSINFENNNSRQIKKKDIDVHTKGIVDEIVKVLVEKKVLSYT